MKCPKCGYHSFEHLDSCKKCGQGLNDHKEKYNLRGFVAIEATAPAATPAAAAIESMDTFDTTDNEPIDFGFDFLDEEDPAGENPESVSLDSARQEINLDQPFSVDSETLPAEDALKDKGKSVKGPEFAF